MAKNTLHALDEEHLAHVTGGDAGIREELLGMLKEELGRRMGQLDAALASDDRHTAIEAAHKLQGSAAYTGAARLGKAAAALETSLREGGSGSQALESLHTAATQLAELLDATQASSSNT